MSLLEFKITYVKMHPACYHNQKVQFYGAGVQLPKNNSLTALLHPGRRLPRYNESARIIFNPRSLLPCEFVLSPTP